jgi:hypothetical protein
LSTPTVATITHISDNTIAATLYNKNSNTTIRTETVNKTGMRAIAIYNIAEKGA